MSETQHVILCEGYDDRAFWCGWLMHLGCRTLFDGQPPKDPWGRKVSGGQFAFESRGGSFIRLIPYGGKSNLRQAVDILFQAQATRPMARLVINLDSDDGADETTTSARDTAHSILRQQAPQASADEHGVYRIRDAVVSAVVWGCDDPIGTPGVPEKQTLERLVAAAIAEAYPGRGQAVADWLAAAPAGSAVSHKHHGLSYLAKWFAEHGCDDFYKALWRDEKVADQLERRLRARGAWQHAQDLADA